MKIVFDPEERRQLTAMAMRISEKIRALDAFEAAQQRHRKELGKEVPKGLVEDIWAEFDAAFNGQTPAFDRLEDLGDLILNISRASSPRDAVKSLWAVLNSDDGPLRTPGVIDPKPGAQTSPAEQDSEPTANASAIAEASREQTV